MHSHILCFSTLSAVPRLKHFKNTNLHKLSMKKHKHFLGSDGESQLRERLSQLPKDTELLTVWDISIFLMLHIFMLNLHSMDS